MALKKQKALPTLQRLKGEMTSELSENITYRYSCTATEHKEEARLVLNALRNYNSLDCLIDNSNNPAMSEYTTIMISLFLGSTKNKHAQSAGARNLATNEIVKSYYFYCDSLESNILNFIADVKDLPQWSKIPRQLILNTQEPNLKNGDCGIMVIINKHTSDVLGASPEIAAEPVANALDLMQAVSMVCKTEFSDSIFMDFCKELSATFISSMYPSFPEWLKEDVDSGPRVSEALTKYLAFFLFGITC